MSELKNEIHGHEVMRLMVNSDEMFTKESLKQKIIDTFGEEARFYTCSASGMDAEGIINFLEAKDKFKFEGDDFTTDPDRICNH